MATTPTPPADAADVPASPPSSWAESGRFVPRAFVQPALAFMRAEAGGGVLMLAAALVAIVLANSAWGDAYFGFFDSRIDVTFGGFAFHHLSELTVREWVNDALMAIFFFVVGLEIKRELVVGELRDPKAAALPVLAAVGGMVVPAGIYLLFNAGGDGQHGWGIPMATDIAFAVGVVSMLGRRVPIAAKLFLLALAIVDDLGAIIVIAVFYTEEMAMGWLVAAAVGLLLVAAMRRANVRALPPYLVVGSFVWLAVLESGVHATVAGVALALLTPVTSFYNPHYFGPRARHLVDRVEEYLPTDDALHETDHHTMERVQTLLLDLRRLSRESLPPLSRLEHSLNGVSSFLIVPLFAFANAGVRISGDALSGAFADTVLVGTALGLLVGKAVGVTGASFVAVKLGIGRLPAKATWSHMVGLGLLAGIGFTVALFVAALSFEPGSPHLDSAKIGIFAASLVAGVAGFVWLRTVAPSAEELDQNADGVPDARQSTGHVTG